MLDGQNSGLLVVDDESGTSNYLPNIAMSGRRGNIDQFDFDNDESQATDEGEGNDRVEEIYKQ